MKRHYLKHVQVYQTDGSSFLSSTVLIANGHIAELGGPPPLDAEIVDCDGGYLLPGLIDCHTHLSLDCRLPNYLERMNGTEEDLRCIAEETLLLDLQSGVTTQRCMGDRFYIDTACKASIQAGHLQGPQLFVSGIGMRSPKGFGYVGMPVSGKDLTAVIHQNVARGADWVKFYETGTVCIDGHIQSFYNAQEIARIIEIAHQLGKPVTSHCIGGEGLQACVENGIDCIEHAYYATPEEIALMRDAGIYVCITAGEYFTDKAAAAPSYQAQLRAQRPRVRESMEALLSSGIPFVLGTDGLHGRLWEEARYAAAFGASNRRILQALTTAAAALLGATQDIGRISPGMAADLVLLQENPLQDISALRAVRRVYQRGHLVFETT